MAKMLYSNQIKINTEKEKDLTQNLTILWATIMGQCSAALQEDVHVDPDYATKSADFDSIWLLQVLQKITAGTNKKPMNISQLSKQQKHFTSPNNITMKVLMNITAALKTQKALLNVLMQRSWIPQTSSNKNKPLMSTPP